MTSSTEWIARARSFAVWAHGTQTYGNNLPYSYHLDSVHGVAARFDPALEVLLAAYLHDVVEDTHVSIGAIEDVFGADVAKLVAAVTNAPGPNRHARHILTYPKIRAAGPNAVLLKLCDRIANVNACGLFGNTRLLKMYVDEHRGFYEALADTVTDDNDKAWTVLRQAFKGAGVEHIP